MNNLFKYIALPACLMLAAGSANAQRTHGVGMHYGGIDFYGPQSGNYFTQERKVLEGKDTNTVNSLLWKSMVKASYWWELSRNIDLSATVQFSGRVDYPSMKDDSIFIARQESGNPLQVARRYIEFGPRISYNILPRDSFRVSPYVLAGINGAFYNDPVDGNSLRIDIPVGAGLNVRLAPAFSLNLESNYVMGTGDKSLSHLVHSAGFVFWFKPGYKPEDLTPTVNPVFIDTDRDGITDSLDKCPTIAGLPNFDGCPDSDGDGVSDNRDACPLVAGIASLNGCPDSDSDGINDKDDQCPYVAGTVANNGCPPPDRDGDGFLDSEDRCPETYSKTNGGCPEIRQEIINQVSKAAKAIFFETGKATLKKTSFKSLDAVVNILNNDPSLYADIEGHTDAVGDDASNMTLSENRAASVRDYFISKGIDGSRLTSKGFGETQPVATNETAAGKAQNRRTEIKLRNYAR